MARILLVDDCSSSLIIQRGLLSKSKHTISISNSATDALQIISNNEFDLACIDIMMPNMNGYQLANAIEENQLNIKRLIAVTAINYDDASTKNRRLFCDWIVKPINTKTYLSIIEKNLNNLNFEPLSRDFLLSRGHCCNSNCKNCPYK